jgi:tetratricopeptide (TPR) repeat protein
MRKPGLFAPRREKRLFKALQAQDAAAIARTGEQFPGIALPAFALSGLMLAGTDPNQALSLLQRAFADGQDPAATPFFRKYVAGEAELRIAEGVTAHLPLGRDVVGLTLAELYQTDKKYEDAIAVVEQLEPTTYAALSLAELYIASKRYQDVVELTNGVENNDDATALLCVYRGVAFREQGFHEAAHESFKQALRSRSRDATIRHLALSERATNYAAQGKRSPARKDLERILAEDSTYEGINERLTALAGE